MDEGESREPTTPFWARTNSSSSSSSSSNSNTKPLMAVALSASIFFIIFFPSILSSSLKGFRPALLKNWWDVLNFVLVLFAVLCGVLGRNTAPADDTDKSPPPITTPATFRRMRSSSYPDLRQEPWWGPPADDSWRFSDDIEVHRNHHRRSNRPRSDHRHLHTEPIVKRVQVDTIEVKPPSPVRSRSPPLPPPPPPPPRQHHQHQPRRRQAKRSDPPPPPPPPPPPCQPPAIERKLHRKESAGAKDIAAAIALFYQKKRKRSSSKIKKIHNNSDGKITDSATKPAPPPPPPPPSMFHNLFAGRKKGSSKKKSPKPIRSSPPPPPPPPSLPSWRRSATKYPLPPSPLRPSQPHSSNPPPKVPNMHYSFSNSFELPPPPPPPPPSLPPSPQPSFVKEAAAEPLFCPSPDVNNKAEMFIERFRAGLKLEKLNSIKEKEKQQQEE